MHERPWRWTAYRVLLSLFLLFHGVTVVSSLARHTATGAAVRSVTRPYESLIGIYQGWTMFSPNPPRVDTWGALRMVDGDGQSHPLPAIWGAREDTTVEWYYRRAGKLERNMLLKSRRKYLRMYAQALCAADPRRQLIEVDRVLRHTPTPAKRRGGAVPTVSQELVLRSECPQ